MRKSGDVRAEPAAGLNKTEMKSLTGSGQNGLIRIKKKRAALFFIACPGGVSCQRITSQPQARLKMNDEIVITDGLIFS
ncbi:hypothetical protein [Pantoea sp. OXWO6B1]|uniref:hypothetical protein n=1 Tax=Pantoea sp. OXWO6B1 TaxID=1835724 RepID=UPI0007C648C4|nr:hypothetical protein [Pantoea sp. OXWO6B1]OAE08616.1 hypothetical protein A6A26_13810 [Pantoea sp. OXWO6B1]